jgi:DNA-binding transcriptional LysR family regulator
MDRLEAMSVFVAVAEVRGFSAAARRLGISASAATRLVAALEEHLGIALLRRTTRSVSLTDAGARYLDRARLILSAVEEAEGSARAGVSEPTGHFVVTAPLVFGRVHVAALMCQFLEANPRVTGELTLADRMVNLLEEGVDVAVRIGALEDSSLRTRVVGRTRRVLVASPTYLDTHRRIRKPTDLVNHRLIHFRSLWRSPEWSFRHAGSEERVAFRPMYTTNSADAAIGHAERGGGIAMVLSYQVTEAVRAGRLQILLPQYELPPLPIQLVFPASRLMSASLRAFIDLTLKSDWQFASPLDVRAGIRR